MKIISYIYTKTMKDRILILKFINGNEEAFTLLAEKYYPKLLGFFSKMTENYTLSQDLTQETLLKISNNIEKYNPKFEFKTWLFSIGKNLMIDHFRKNKMRTDDIENYTLKDNHDIEKDVETNEKLKAFNTAVKMLSPKQKTAFLLHYQQELPYKEIAVVMDESLSNIKILLHRAKEKLKKLLEKTNEI